MGDMYVAIINKHMGGTIQDTGGTNINTERTELICHHHLNCILIERELQASKETGKHIHPFTSACTGLVAVNIHPSYIAS